MPFTAPPALPTTDEASSIAALEEILGRKRAQLALKRGLDIAVSAAALAVLWPLLALLALAVALEDRGPALYRQERIGRGGRPFRILKFRTMVQNADRKGLPLTIGDDARVTRVGRFLRRTKLDELAQLINVLRGEMGLVGPRPEVGRYVALYTPLQRMALRIRPGITDLASIRYRDENALLGRSADPERAYIQEVMPAKLAINLDYLRTCSVWGDCRLIASTLLHLGRDAARRRGSPDGR